MTVIFVSTLSLPASFVSVSSYSPVSPRSAPGMRSVVHLGMVSVSRLASFSKLPFFVHRARGMGAPANVMKSYQIEQTRGEKREQELDNGNNGKNAACK